MSSKRKTFSLIGLSFTLVTLLGFVLPGMSLADPTCSVTKHADVVAIDHKLVYNRHGAFSPNGMIYALRRDVVDDNIFESDGVTPRLPGKIGNESAAYQRWSQGKSFFLRPGKRPRPLVLRVNEGECLHIKFQNLVKENPADDEQPNTRALGIQVAGLQLVDDIHDGGTNVGKNNSAPGAPASGLSGLVEPGQATEYTLYAHPGSEGIYLFTTSPVIGGEGGGASAALGLFGSVNVEPPGAVYYRSQLTRQEMDWATTGNFATGHPNIKYDATYPAVIGNGKPHPYYAATDPIIEMVDASNNIVHSDIRAIIACDGGSLCDSSNPHNFAPGTYPKNPVIAPNLEVSDCGDAFRNLIPDCSPAPGKNVKHVRPREEPFREFSVFFHDEVAAVQAFPEFEDEILLHTLHCCRDAFAINYAIGGIGAEILANRKGVGPEWDCVECKYEEFFLTSWALGDPGSIVDIPANASFFMGGPRSKDHAPENPTMATRVFYPQDPANVEHSYIGDHVKMRNIHAGPKEHHIFHLHSHQWLFTPDDDNSAYLDSQSVGPGSSYNYDITYNGSGNRNQTPGDAIYHCHFYPHFAQGMWALWRNHDVFENGTPMELDSFTGLPFSHDGTVTTPQSGVRAYPDGEIVTGTPIPAVVPIPTLAMAPMPANVSVMAKTFNNVKTVKVVNVPAGNILTTSEDPTEPPTATQHFLETPGLITVKHVPFGEDPSRDIGSNIDLASITPFKGVATPGYPFFIPGEIGHRPPNPALDHAPRTAGDGGPWEDGGMHDPADANNSRHVVLGGVVGEIHTNRLDMRKVTDEMVVRWLPETGSPVEQAGMEYHAQRVHSSITPAGDPLGYILNGRGPVSGAPFADPCIDDQGQPVGNWSVGEVKVPGTNGNVANTLLGPDNSAPARTYKAADIQLDMVINKLGEHYPQARMLALWDDVDGFMYNNVPPEPLFFRANSRECIEFWQTNLVPHEYELDDFQVRTPTDIIGQHIHLVKFDVTSADGAGNGWNYEDAAFSPGEIIERIHAVNAANGLHLDPSQTTCLDSDGLSASGCVFPQEHSFFAGDLGLGAVTVRQRWYVDETMSMTGDDRTLRTVYTHDHYGPSTHQQVGLYAGLLIEPEDSEWFDMVSGAQMGGRFDGGPTSWRANIHTNTKLNGDPDPDQSESYREFMFEFADFALAYSPDNQTQSLGTTVTQDMIYPPTDVYTQDQLDELTAHNFVNRDLSINPPAKETVGLPFVLVKAKHCPGIDPLGPESKTCPEGVSADDPGSFVANYRNESVTHRIRNPNPQAKADVDVYPYFDTVTFPGDGDTDHDGDGLVDLEDVDVDPLDGPFPNLSAGDIDHDGDGVYDLADVDEAPYAGTLTFPGEGDTDHNGDGSVNASELESDDCLFPSDFSKKSIGADGVERTINGCQAAGMPGDLGHVYRSDIGRANPWLNTAVGNTPYAPLTGGVRPGDPFTPLMQVFEDDRLQFRFMVGAHEEGHVETIQGAKWLFEPNSKTSGWRGALMAGISEHFEFEIQNLAPVKGGAPFADMLYNFDTSVDGAGNGVWGLIRSYSSPQALDPAIDGTLLTLPNNSNGKSPGGGDIENMAQFNGVCPADTENKKGKNSGPNPYWGGERKFHVVAIRAADALPGGTLEYNSRVGGPFAKHPGPLHDPAAIMYVLANDLDGNNQLKPGVPVEPLVLRARAGECVHVTLDNRLPDDEAQVLDPDHFSIVPMVIERFNTNEMHISSEVGLRPQMVAYDVATSEGVNLGFNVSHWSKRTAGPGETVTYKWYMGDTRIIPNPEHSCTIIEKKYKGQIQEVEECTGKPFIKHATPIEFGATNLIPADPIEHAAKGLIGSLIVEPAGATWTTDSDLYASNNCSADPGQAACQNLFNTRHSATVNHPEQDNYGSWPEDEYGNPTGNILDFREFVMNFQDDIQLRDSNGDKPICPVAGAGEEAVEGGEPAPGEEHPSADANGAFDCLGPEDPEDSGNKAVNYKSEPAWFRKGYDPGAPFGITRMIDFKDLLANDVRPTDASGELTGAALNEDPQTPIFTATAGDKVRLRVLQSGGHPRNHVFAMQGHIWQREGYQKVYQDLDGDSYMDDTLGSERIGHNPLSEHYGTQAGHGPQNHFNMSLENGAGGYFGVTGDYLWRNQATFGFEAGHWGLMRVLPKP